MGIPSRHQAKETVDPHPATRCQIQGITVDEELDQLGVRLLTAESLEEMGLNGGASR